MATLLRTEDEIQSFIDNLPSDYALPVVLDRLNIPWIVYVGEDGDGYAHTVPSEESDDQATVTWGALITRQRAVPLLVVWDGVTGWARPIYSPLDPFAVRAVLEGIYEDARAAITAPEHNAFMGAASRLERLLGIEPGTPPFNRDPISTRAGGTTA